MLFIDWNGSRRAIDRRRRRKYEFLYFSGTHRFEETDSTGHILLEENARVRHRFGYEGFRREMENCVELVFREQGPHRPGIGNIALAKRCSWRNCLAKPCREIIHHHHRMASSKQFCATD